MLSSNGNPFLRAEYLNPPPATNTMDSKKSPLALLAQTCSQIGADPLPTLATKTTTTTTTSSTTVDQRKKSECLSNDLKSTANNEANNNRRPSSGNESSIHPVGKTTKIKTNESSNNNRLTPTDRRSKSSSPKNRFNAGCNTMDQPTASASTASMMNHPLLHPSQQQQQQQQLGMSTSHPSQHLMMAAALASNDPSCSGASAMSLANSYKSLMASAYPASPYAPYVGHHPSMATAASAGGYGPPHPSAFDFGAYANALNLNAAAVAKSSTSLSSSSASSGSSSSGHAASASSSGGFIPTTTSMNMMNGYLNSHPAAYALQQAMHQQQQHYGNVANRFNSAANAKNGTAAAAAADSCRDPYCTGCPASNTTTNAGHIHMVCTVGCGLSVQCDHVKVPIGAHHLQIMSSGPPASSPSASACAPPPSSPHRPYICNWIVGDNYCGKRFTSSDELLQHLRTHTNLASSTSADGGVPPTTLAAFAHPSSMMRAAYPTPPLSPLSAARYHPYGKSNLLSTSATPAQLFHPGMAAAMAAMAGSYPGQSLFHPALAPYYSHLSLFAHQANSNHNNQPSTRQVPGPAPLGGAAGLGGQP